MRYNNFSKETDEFSNSNLHHLSNYENTYSKTNIYNETFGMDEILDSIDENKYRNESEFSNELLPDGKYDFIVESARIKDYAGGEKIPPCKAIDFTFIVEDSKGKKHRVYKNIYCVEKGKECLNWFRKSVGLTGQISVSDLVKKCNTQKLTGNATINTFKYTNSFGETGEKNQIKYFTPKERSLPW